MIVFLCDQCQKIISEDELRSGSTRKKNGEVICGDCSVEQKNSRELFSCDRCNKKHSLDLLRTGKATLIKGKLYCHRCREFAEKTSREILDFKYLSAVFVLFLGIPMMIGSTMWLYRYMQDISSNAVSPQESGVSQEISDLKAKVSVLIDALNNKNTPTDIGTNNTQQSTSEDTQVNNASQQNNTPQNNTQPRKSLDDILNKLKKDNPAPQQPQAENNIRTQITQMNLNIQKAFAERLKSPNEAERVAAILQIMQNRERVCIPQLVASLEDNSPLVRSFAAKALGALGANSSIPQLLSNVSDKNIHVRRSIAKSLTMLTGRGFKDHQDLTAEDKQKLIDFINRER